MFDSTHIFIQFASEFQCYTEVISVVPQDISVKATHREYQWQKWYMVASWSGEPPDKNAIPVPESSRSS